MEFAIHETVIILKKSKVKLRNLTECKFKLNRKWNVLHLLRSEFANFYIAI